PLVVSLCYPVVFSGSADHRHLHSFPTRRSSDLLCEEGTLGLVVDHRRLDDVDALHGRRWCCRAFRAGGKQCRNEKEQDSKMHDKDRKSTRLNSSHVKISYAVFCLKKKNTKKQQY